MIRNGFIKSQSGKWYNLKYLMYLAASQDEYLVDESTGKPLFYVEAYFWDQHGLGHIIEIGGEFQTKEAADEFILNLMNDCG